MTGVRCTFLCCLLTALTWRVGLAAVEPPVPRPLTLVVMDPLAAPLACDCVQGYAQRKYEALAAFLQTELEREVRVVWSESLADSQRQAGAPADLVIGKHSVVLADAAEQKMTVKPVAQLTGTDGNVTLTGLIVVRRDDPAQTVADLKGYRIFFGPADCDEKSGVAKRRLAAGGVPLPATVETEATCSVAAAKLMELPADEKVAAVISSYAKPLLEGCGTIAKGDLRVIGETEPVPFITAFLNGELPHEDAVAIGEALLDVGLQAELLMQLETATGFEPWPDEQTSVTLPPRDPAGTLAASTNGRLSGALHGDWPGWRGSRRDGYVPWLPDRLPAAPQFAWRVELPSDGVGGVAVAGGRVVVGSRDVLDQHDLFQCFDAESGALHWQHIYLASGQLDYGNSPRATPLIHEPYVYTLGAWGHVCCLELETGLLVWQRDLTREFGAPTLTWGHAGSPLIADNKLIVQPGGPTGSLVALDAEYGDTVWQVEGSEPSYSSLIRVQVAGTDQLVGYDAQSLGGWDVATGRRLWQVVPPRRGDFNVPTVAVVGDRLLVASENNGTRLYAFGSDGVLAAEPGAVNEDLAPDAHSPVVAGGYAYGVWNGLYQLDFADGLRACCTLDDEAFSGYASLIASDDHLLLLSAHAELVLLSLEQGAPAIASRLQLGSASGEILAHPAVAGRAIYVRMGKTLARLDLE